MLDKFYSHFPMNSGAIFEIYVFLSVDENGDGICAAKFGDLMLPLVTGDANIIEKMKLEAEQISKDSGKRVVLAKFNSREDIWSSKKES